MKFDYSDFHPLDHAIWDPYCWGWAGGIPRHIKLWWSYQHKWPWEEWVAKRGCAKGNHHMVAYYRDVPDLKEGVISWLGKPAGYLCRDCSYEEES